MGISGLAKLIGDLAPSSVKESEIKNYFGRKVAIDASMSIYQFLIAVRSDGSSLTNAEGETTSHLMGMFYRTIRLVENGIKPVYVFDGKPPTLKSGELLKRQNRREEAQKELEKAEEAGDAIAVDKFSRRLVKVTPEHNEECKRLLTFMGIPWVTAPCEAEAQCSALVRAGHVFATGSEDMDSLTFGSNVLLRHLTFSEARKLPIKEFNFSKLLEELKLTHDEFVDLCILLGCDYCESLKGIGPKRSIELIRQYRNLEAILNHIDKSKHPVPEGWMYREARELFKSPIVTDPAEIELKWQDPDEEGLVQYMANEKGFNEERIRNGAKKLLKARRGATQGRLDNFFSSVPSDSANSASRKRKMDKENEISASKKKKGTTKAKANPRKAK